MSKRDLLAYWPTLGSLADCVKLDAESASEAVSLAVHQPMRFERRVIGNEGGPLDECDEHALLSAFLEPNLPEGRVILPIVGTSGVGKSHAVRWLETQMKGMRGADKRVVIRIPKGLSLKAVLSHLLGHLNGPTYEPYRKELERAQEQLDPKEAAGLLCEMLAQTLTNMWEAAREKSRIDPGDRQAKECEAFCQPNFLPALLRNQTLRDRHFVRTSTGSAGVAKRLVEHLTETRAADDDDNRQHLFTPDDLMFETLDSDLLGKAEIRALHKLETQEEQRRIGVRFLNAALDGAKQRLVNLDPTVADLFDAVRRELHKDKKELVLLIEDFVVLSGLQKQLLQVMIKEAIRDGRQILCTMRTALAYTPGYVDAATVLTRAGIEYRIPDSSGSEQEILERTVRQVGAYLNAARVGQAGLERAYSEPHPESSELRSWVPQFKANVERDARGILEAFGVSEDRYELFPFNANAVHELAREGCLEAGNLVYNPRLVIKNILRRVLQNRDLYESGDFPNRDWSGQGRALPARVVEHVKRQVPPGEFLRYMRFLAYWGGHPDNVNAIAAVDERVFAAFGFDKKLIASRAFPTPPIGTTPTPNPAPVVQNSPPKSESALDAREVKWRKSLDEWRAGGSLSQSDANKLRQLLAEAMAGSVDWDWDLFRPMKDLTLEKWFQWIYIPRAAGGEARAPDEAMAEVCTEAELASEFESSRVHSALMAVVRFHLIHQSWDFEGAEESLPQYVALVETLSQRARVFVRNRYFRLPWDPTPTLVDGLLMGARALGIEGANRDTHHFALLGAMLVQKSESLPMIPAAETDAGLMTWNALVRGFQQCRAESERDGVKFLSWRSHLLNLLGARQGGADLVHAIDVLRLKPAMEQTVKSWTVAPVSGSPTGVPEFNPFKAAAQELRKNSVGVEKAREYFFDWYERMSGWLGEGFDKGELVLELLETVRAIKEAGMQGGASAAECVRLIERFREARIKEALSDVARLVPGAPRGIVLTILGRGYGPLAKLCDDLKQSVDQLLANAELQIGNEASIHGGSPLQGALAMLATELQETAQRLEELKTYGTA